MKAAAILIAALTAAAPAFAGEATALFSSSDPIEITITGPIGEIARKARTSTDPLAATLGYGAEQHAIDLSARGNSRRRPETCKFPPLRVSFTEKPDKESLFHKQKNLKLVTHCRATNGFEKHLLLEYSAYRMLNALTEQSFRVRLATVRYVEAGSGKVTAERPGFFIEDIDDLADRVGLDDVKTGKLSITQHDAGAAARTALFFHMIANHDWSMVEGPDGECCHNGKLLGAADTSAQDLVYVPYDFDYSGFVDAPYAVPPEKISIRSVRTRYYRSPCSLNGEVKAAAALFRERRPQIEGAVRSTPGLDRKAADKAVKFLEGFFSDIATNDAVDELLERCR